ncbi:hypothetical protein [Hoeflea sp.]|uniref:hypothetical protein n=1 Tax=Hoeflea sp. TaxID=1940281 RepID=UPI003BB0629C
MPSPKTRAITLAMNTNAPKSPSAFARFAAATALHARLGGLLLLALSGDRRAR